MWREQSGTSRCGLARLYSGGRALLYAPITRDAALARLPVALRVLLENLTRQALLGADVSGEVEALTSRLTGARVGVRPARVLLDELAGVPLLIDLVCLRDAVAAAGANADAVSPKIPIDLLIESGSAPAGSAGGPRERGELLAWCRRNFGNLRMLPAGARNTQWHDLECAGQGVRIERVAGAVHVYPDMLVGTHPQTGAAGGCGVLGWAVGGLEATAALVGKPLSLAVPEVVGVELRGRPPAHIEPGDLALRLSEELRSRTVAGKLVEFFGRGVEALPVPIRATVAGMAPETGAVCLYFPTDRRTLDYLQGTGREGDRVRLLEQYVKLQGLWLDVGARAPDYDAVVSLDLGRIGGSAAGPRSRAHVRERPLARPALGRAARGSIREYAGRSPRNDRGAGDAHGNRFPWPRPGGWVSRVPFFDGLPLSRSPLGDLLGARPLVIVGDSVRAEDISPSGPIEPGSAAEAYLRAAGASSGELDTYEMRRGNYEVAVRATFAGPRLKNRLARGAGGGVTTLMPERVSMSVFDAASEYQRRNVPLLVIAGRRYGCGCGHDWAAKGVASLGVKAVLAESFDRIHRASLIAAGVLPLLFLERWKHAIAALDGSETFDLPDLEWSVGVRTQVLCIIRRESRPWTRVALRTAVETGDELYYLRSGGVLPALWREQLREPRELRVSA
ncbi:MAG: hypothetical protein KGL45_11670 [Gammaproteobacteria bacterium]|nr:hypothetical protein [Gammaproteobacteria bacterium]